MKNEKPDIVIFMTDQWNARCLGYLGTPSVQTPNIDKLAEEGTAFSAAYTASPVCQPARASFSSGLYPHNHGFWSNYTGRRFPAEEMTMFRDLGGAGYPDGRGSGRCIFSITSSAVTMKTAGSYITISSVWIVRGSCRPLSWDRCCETNTPIT